LIYYNAKDILVSFSDHQQSSRVPQPVARVPAYHYSLGSSVHAYIIAVMKSQS